MGAGITIRAVMPPPRPSPASGGGSRPILRRLLMPVHGSALCTEPAYATKTGAGSASSGSGKLRERGRKRERHREIGPDRALPRRLDRERERMRRRIDEMIERLARRRRAAGARRLRPEGLLACGFAARVFAARVLAARGLGRAGTRRFCLGLRRFGSLRHWHPNVAAIRRPQTPATRRSGEESPREDRGYIAPPAQPAPARSALARRCVPHS